MRSQNYTDLQKSAPRACVRCMQMEPPIQCHPQGPHGPIPHLASALEGSPAKALSSHPIISYRCENWNCKKILRKIAPFLKNDSRDLIARVDFGPLFLLRLC